MVLSHAVHLTSANYLLNINDKSLTRINKIGTLEFNTVVLKGFLLDSKEYLINLIIIFQRVELSKYREILSSGTVDVFKPSDNTNQKSF